MFCFRRKAQFELVEADLVLRHSPLLTREPTPCGRILAVLPGTLETCRIQKESRAVLTRAMISGNERKVEWRGKDEVATNEGALGDIRRGNRSAGVK